MTQVEGVRWIAQLFDEDPSRLTADTVRADIPAWDSLGVLTLMASLDSDFGITLTDEQLDHIRRVDDILQLLRDHGLIEATPVATPA